MTAWIAICRDSAGVNAYAMDGARHLREARDSDEAAAAAWAAEERQELLERAAMAWAKSGSAEWRTRFDEYGPWL